MTTLTSQLVIELLDGVTSPARRAANALAGISNRIAETNGQRVTFGDRLNAAITRNNRSLEQARGGLVDAAAGFYMLRAAIGGPIRAAMQFEEAMANVTKVVDFPTPEAFADFERDLFQLSRRIPLTVQELTDIAAAAGEAGFAADDLLTVTEDAAMIAVAFGTSAREAGDMLAAMQQSYGMSREQALSLADAMNHLSNNMASSAPELMNFWSRVAADAGRAGFSQEQAVALGSAMIASGHEAEVAATSFRAMIRALTRGESATTRQVDAFERLGISTTEVAARMQEDALGTTREVLEAISRMPAEMQNAMMSDIFGDEARALGSVATNLEFFDRAVGAVANSSAYAGSALREFEVRSGTAANSMTLLMNRVTELSVAVGEALVPALVRIVEVVGPIISRLAELASTYPDVTAAVVGATAAVVAFRVAIAASRYVGLLGRGGVLSLIAAGYNTIGRAAIGARAAASNMIGLQSALAAMSGGSLSTLGKVGAGLRGIALAVPGVSALSAALTAIGGVFAGISAPVVATLAAIAAAGFAIWRYWDRLTAIYDGVANVIGERLSPVIERFRPVLQALEPVANALLAPFRALRDAASSLFGFISGLFESDFFTREQLSETERAAITARTEEIITTFLDLPARLLEVGRQAIQGLWDGMVSRFEEFMAWVRGIPGRIAEAIGNIDLGSLIFGGAPAINIAPTITPNPGSVLPRAGGNADIQALEDYLDGTRARGGPISRGGRYLVGEHGPELITASRSGYVHPTGQGPSGGPVEIAVNNHFSIAGGADPERVAAQVVERIEDSVRTTLRGVFADTGMRIA